MEGILFLGRTEWLRTHRYAQPGPFFCEDQELLLRSYEHSRFATVEEILFGYRVRHEIDGKKQLKTHWTLFQIQWRHYLVGPDIIDSRCCRG